ncbi:MAG: HAD-IA family hydrolase [candidate division KSB1 bacterium]|nr:HAD-IA family hydrolase [candidate division KSB1 bacterium]
MSDRQKTVTNAPHTRFDYIIFDLGGVLVEYQRSPSILEYTESPLTKEDLSWWWQRSSTVIRFEKGEISETEFSEKSINELNLQVSTEKFLDWFASSFKGLLPGVSDIIMQLSQTHQLATISNVNKVFWDKFEKTDIYTFFSRRFLSFELGIRKPDLELYKIVLQTLKAPPHRLLYFDDLYENIDAAKTLGIQSYVAKNVKDIIKIAEKFDLLNN